MATAVAVALYGCGGGSGSTGTSAGAGTGAETSSEATVRSSSLSKEEFTAKADAICTRGKKQGLVAMSAYVKEHPGSSKSKSEQLIEAIHATFLPQIQKQVDQIRALGAPEGEEEQVTAILAAMEEGVEAAASASANAQFSQSFEHSAELAREYGIEACVYG
jgi:hypothetical protein